MNTLDNLVGSPIRTASITRNLSSPRLTRLQKSIPHWENPHNDNISGMQSIKQQHFYIEKLRVQRQRMQLLKTEFEKKDCTIETLNAELYKITLMYEQAMGYRRKHDQLLAQFQRKASEFEQLSLELSKARTQIDVFEVEFQKIRGDSDRQLSEIEVMNAEINGLQHSNRELDRERAELQREMDNMCRKHKGQMDNIKAKWSDLKSELEQLRKQNCLLKQQSYRARIDYDQLKHHLKKLQAQLNESRTKALRLQQDLDKTVVSFDEQRSNELLAYEQYSQDLSCKLSKAQDKCSKLETTLKKNKCKYKETENCIKEVHCRLERQISKAEYLEQQMRNKDALIERYKITEKQQMDLVERLKSELKQHQENFRKYQRGPEKALRTELQRLRRQLYLLRNAEVDKIERVFHSFGINDNTRM